MKHKVYRALGKLAVVCVFLLLQFWLMDYKFTDLIDFKLFGVMLLSIFLLSMTTTKKSQLNLDQVVGYYTLMVGVSSMVMLAIKSRTSGIIIFTAEVIQPLLYALFIYVSFSIIYSFISSDSDSKKTTKTSPYDSFELTTRERALAHLIVKGKTNKEIASELYIAESTVKKHVQNIYRKCDVNNRKEFCERLSALSVGSI